MLDTLDMLMGWRLIWFLIWFIEEKIYK